MRFIRPILAALGAALLVSCGSGGGSSGAPTPPMGGGSGGGTATNPVTIRIVAFNDFHGAIAPFGAPLQFRLEDGSTGSALVGGAAWLGDAVDRVKAQNPNTLVISAGDLVGASPAISARFLDEPTIGAMNRIGLDFNAVGNHEFDEGVAELKRLQTGGCAAHTGQQPCALENFAGAQFRFLAANVRQGSASLFPASATRQFGSGADRVTIGIVGLTLEGTPAATSGSVAGLTFEDEAEAINREAAALRSAGADAVIVAVHEGLTPSASNTIGGCDALSGPLRTILDRLNSGVDLVVSGHTHRAYICDYGTIDAARPMLVTSVQSSGRMFTDIELRVNAGLSRTQSAAATNVILQREGTGPGGQQVPPLPGRPVFVADPVVAAYVETYRQAAQTMIAAADEAELQ